MLPNITTQPQVEFSWSQIHRAWSFTPPV